MSLSKILGFVISLLFIGLIGCGGGGSSSGSGAPPNSGVIPGPGGTTVTVTGLQISQALLNLPQGTSHQLQATALFSDGNRLDVTALAGWSSNAPVRASVQSGLVRGEAPSGEAEITASFQGFSDRCRVTLTDPLLLGFSVAPSPLNLPAGIQDHLTATAEFSDGSRPDITQDVDWISDDPGVAQINNSPGTRGQVLAIFKGTTTIRGTFRGQTVATTVNVGDARLLSIEVDPSEVTLAKGLTRAFRAFGQYSDGVPRELTTQVTWSSTDTNLAIVSNLPLSEGIVLAVNPGAVEIRATLGDVVGNSDLTVSPAELVSLRVEPVNSSLPKGLKQNFKAFGTLTDGSQPELTDQVTWSSSDSSLARISNATGSQGELTAVEEGKVEVEATLFSIKGKTELTVVQAVLTGLQPLQPQVPIVSLSAHNQAFTVNATYSDGLVVDVSTSATWESSNTAVATISPGGNASLRLEGQTEIKASLGAFTSSTQLQVVKLLGYDWTRREGTDQVFSALFAKGKFFFGARSGIVTSTDTRTWKPHRLEGIIVALIEAEGRILAAGSEGHIYSSPDGESWAQIAIIPNFSPSGLAFGDGLYVVVGAGVNKIFTSPDGSNWTSSSSGSSRNLREVRFGNGIFVAVDDQGLAFRSSDGVSWTSSAVTSSPTSVAFGDGKFVVVGNSVSVSSDGLNWTHHSAGNPNIMVGVVFDGSNFVAVCSRTVLRSTNGTNWSRVTIGSVDTSYNEVVAGNGKYLVGGFLRTPFLESADLVTWTQTGYPSRPAIGNSITFGNGRYVIPAARSPISGELELLTSVDGVNWTSVPTPGPLIQAVWDGTRFLAIGRDLAATSPDGLSWSFHAATGVPSSTNSLVFGKGRYLCASDSSRLIQTSTDGLVWTPVDVGIATGSVLDLAFGNDKFVAVTSNGGRISRSDDGLTWTATVVPGSTAWHTVTAGAGQFVALSGARRALSSTDAITWTLHDSQVDQFPQDVTYANGLFVAVRYGDFASISADGKTWIAVALDNLDGLTAIAGGGGRFVGVNGLGDIMTSP